MPPEQILRQNAYNHAVGGDSPERKESVEVEFPFVIGDVSQFPRIGHFNSDQLYKEVNEGNTTFVFNQPQPFSSFEDVSDDFDSLKEERRVINSLLEQKGEYVSSSTLLEGFEESSPDNIPVGAYIKTNWDGKETFYGAIDNQKLPSEIPRDYGLGEHVARGVLAEINRLIPSERFPSGDFGSCFERYVEQPLDNEEIEGYVEIKHYDEEREGFFSRIF